jgi:hypothetical protein
MSLSSRCLRASLLVVLVVGLPSCGGDKEMPGAEGAQCQATTQCQSGLVCIQKGTARVCSQLLPECSVCSVDSDCIQGLFCTAFSDGSRRCGSGLGATSCRIP